MGASPPGPPDGAPATGAAEQAGPAKALPRRLPRIEGARAVGAFAVLLTHAGYDSGAVFHGVFGAFLAHADWGVALFFVLSGFLLSRPWVREVQTDAQRPRLGRYFKHRLARILPAYWVALAAILLTTGRGASTEAMVSNVTLTQGYTGLFLPSFFQTWSLVTEVAFYVALPLLAPLLIRRSIKVSLILLGGTALIAPIWIYLIKGPLAGSVPGVAISWLPGHLDWFCIGMALAVLETALRTEAHRFAGIARRPTLLLVLAAALYAVAMTPITGPVRFEAPVSPGQAIARELLYGAIALLCMVAMLVPTSGATLWGRGLDSSTMRWAGRVSYAFFLWHTLLLTEVRGWLGLGLFGGGFWVSLALTLVLTLVVSQLSWVLVERSSLRLVGASTA